MGYAASTPRPFASAAPLPQQQRYQPLVCIGVYLACRAPVGIGGNLVGEGGLDDIGLLLGVYRTVPEAHEGEQENKRTRERENEKERENMKKQI